ncbi:MAG: DUF4157 domain-containing protein, partial [Anaerolineales bacterium]|nr:DUF4157 domain-containing protein [Anaerolineales bacterium]
EAAASAKSIRALAYTAGSDVVFDSGRYAPETSEGRKLLAHELAHVAQQRPGVISRAVTPDYSFIQSNLTYGVIDWEITETECDQVLYVLSTLSPEDFEDTVHRMQRDGLVTRLIENTSPTSRAAHATMIGRMQSMASIGPAIGEAIRSLLPPAAEPAAAEPAPEEASRAPESFDPCLVDAYALTNAGLLSYYRRVHAVVGRGRDAPGYFDNRNLQRRLITERDRRVNMGHAWLATMPETIPRTLRRIVDGPSGTFRVIDVPGSEVAGAPADHSRAPLMTQGQFDRFREERNIERVSADTYLMRRRAADIAPPAMFGATVTLGGLYNAPGDLPFLWGPRGTSPLAPGAAAPWPALADVFYRPAWFEQSPAYMQADRLQNPPAMNPQMLEQLETMLRNYRGAPGVPRRPASSLILDPNAPVTTGTAAAAITDIPNLGRSRVGGASAAALPAHLLGTPGTTGGSVFVPVNPTAVSHAEHVALENMRIQIDRALALGEITRADLRGRTVHVLVEQEPCASCASGAGEGAPGVLEQFARRYPELTLEVRNLRTSRSYIYRAGALLNPGGEAPALPMEIPAPIGGSVESVMTPEFARTLRHGGGAGGELRAMGAAGLRGGGMSGVIAVATSAGIMVLDTREHPEWMQELALTGGLGFGAGFLGSSTEQVIISRGTGAMLTSIVESGATRLTPGMVTGLGRAGGGAVGAMFIEGISIGLLEEREHFAPEVATRMTRSAALGAGSVWAGAAIGAAAGSAVPVAGTAVGFIVGLIAGGILYFVGDRVVPGGREDWDSYEAGCHFRRSAPPSEYRPAPYGFCFTGGTLVTMADGTQRRIDGLRVGDAVLSCRESDGALRPGKVLKIERRTAPQHLRLRLAREETEVGVTGEHPIHSEGLWLPARLLCAGSLVTRLDGRNHSVGEAEISDVTTDSRPADVYDLSISEYHTFFADGILAHNKIM